jgi:hypothetical protein
VSNETSGSSATMELPNGWQHARELPTGEHNSETDAKLAQKLGQLQPFIAVFLQEYVGQLPSCEPTT